MSDIIQPWRERVAAVYGESFTARQQRYVGWEYAEAEIADLRAALAATQQAAPIVGQRETTEAEQRARVADRFASRPQTPTTADFDLPAPNDAIVWQQGKPAATVIKKGADRQWMSENLGALPDGTYSLYLTPQTSGVRDLVLEEAAMVCDGKYEARASSGHPREASAARSLAEEIRALKSAITPDQEPA